MVFLDISTMNLEQEIDSGLFQVFRLGHSSRLYHRKSSIHFKRPTNLCPVSVHKVTDDYFEITGFPKTTPKAKGHKNGPINRGAATGKKILRSLMGDAVFDRCGVHTKRREASSCNGWFVIIPPSNRNTWVEII